MLKRRIAFLFLLLMTSCASTVPPVVVPPVEPKSTYLQKVHPKVVLVLGSGSARGFAHVGVLKALEENHIPIDMIVGTSAGSIVGSLYADNPFASELEHLLLTTSRDQVISFSLAKLFSGPLSGEVLQHYLVDHLRATTFNQLTIPFVTVATNLGTGKIHVFSSGPIAPAVNASSAVPPFFQPVHLYGETFVDGGLIDPVAVDVAKQFHPKIIIAVNLDPSLSSDFSQTNPSIFLRGFNMMLSQLTAYSAQEANVIIHPKIKDISMFDGTGRKQSIAAGFDATIKMIPSIQKLLAKNHISLNPIGATSVVAVVRSNVD